MAEDNADGGFQAVKVESATVAELHLRAWPETGLGGRAVAPVFDDQVRSMYRRLAGGLRVHGMSSGDIVTERVFLDDVATHGSRLLDLREEFRGGADRGVTPPALTLTGQPPASPGRACEVQVVALRSPRGSSLPSRKIGGLPPGASGTFVEIGGMALLSLAGLTGWGAGGSPGFHEQASSMFHEAGAVLEREGLSFRDVARTWISIADIGRDYAAFNLARRAYFKAQGIDPPPASTATGGVPYPPGRGCALGLLAIGGDGRRNLTPFRIPAMCEAASYGSDFSRGMRVDLPGRSSIFVSGTSSIDAEGRVVHPGDIEGQVDRMLANIEELLATQGSGYADIVCAVTYLKSASYAGIFSKVSGRRGFPAHVPNTLCVSDICRPEWLCEMEVTAVRLAA